MKKSRHIEIIRAVHLVIVILYAIAIPTLIICAPWYISVPLIGMMVNNTLPDSETCVLTKVENQYREVFGLPKIESFLQSIIEQVKEYGRRFR